MAIKHVFFDLDHTLWDFETNSAKAFEFIFNDNDVQVNLEDFLGIYAPINQKYWKLYREERVSKSALRYKRLKETFDVLNYKISDDLIDHLAKVYIYNLPNNNYLFDGTIDILNYLEPKYEMHIITNGFDEVQQLKLEKSGIKKYFDKIVTSESVGVKKPNPKIFDFALQTANALAEHSIMIGDNFEVDIMGAQQIGMQTIFFNYQNEHVNDNILSVNNLLEIKQYL